MSQFTQWLAMGGYSIYVWPAYGLLCAVLTLNIVSVKLQRVRTRKRLQRWFKRH